MMKKIEVIVAIFIMVVMVACESETDPVNPENPENPPTPISVVSNRLGVTYLSETSVQIVIEAPNKESVAVVGDFNDWKVSSDYQMVKDGERFAIVIENLEEGKEYAYQFVIDETLYVADPYAEKYLDPWNDSYISSEVYPNLKAFPDGANKENIVSVFQTGQKEFDWTVEEFQVPAKEEMIIYELLVRDFDANHTYKSVRERLDYIENLGVNVLELMPVNEFEGNSSWGYNPMCYFAPDKYYGPKEELKKLIDECHQRGIAVVVDMVLNHSFGLSPLLRMYYDGTNPTSDNPWYNTKSNFSNPDAQWGFDFNHESSYTQALVDSVNSFWMEEYKVDGFRFDFTKGFSNNIKGSDDEWGSKYDADRVRLLKRMADEIWKRKSDAIVAFEHLAENSEETELASHGIMLWGNNSYAAQEAGMGWTEERKTNFDWAHYRTRGWSEPNVIGYMESHDEERVAYKMTQWGAQEGDYDTRELATMCDRLEMNAAMYLLIPGPKMIWQFGELGYDVSIDEGGRTSEKPIRWDYFDNADRKDLYTMYGKIAKLKQEESLFWTDPTVFDVADAVKQMIFTENGRYAFVFGNWAPTEQEINMDLPSAGTWTNALTKETISIGEEKQTKTLAPGEWGIWIGQE